MPIPTLFSSFCCFCRCANEYLQKQGCYPQGCLAFLGCTEIFSKFYNILSKNEQYLFLQGQIDAGSSTTKSSQRQSSKSAENCVFKFHFVNGNKRSEILISNFTNTT
ncbi:hypothetical protein J6590_028200 [Homalodisca vitripennis]|nr:hypothetical protein J6590_028200 [Homalodisca vitripennis]